MPRKKSAAKKAKEAAAAAATSTTGTATTGLKSNDSIALTTSGTTHPAREKLIQESQKQNVKDNDLENFSSFSSSSDEEEDEYGDLITEDVEQGINQVMEIIKKNPSKLLDPSVKFFDDPETAADKANVAGGKSLEKPMYLKDYHRQMLLDGSYKEFDEGETVDGVKSFAAEQKEEREKLLSDIKSAFKEANEDGADDGDDDDEDDDGFLKKKDANKTSTLTSLEENGEAASTAGPRQLPDPEKDQQGFLSAFLDQKAWIPTKGDKVLNLDQIDKDDEEEFDDAAEQFETAYNFRYEDPNSTEIISYARNQASLRRSKTNARKRARDKEHEEKRKEEEKKKELLKKKKTAKLNKVIDRLAKIKEAVGEEVPDEVIQRVFGESLLNDDFDDADWDNKMAQIFDEQYYGAEVEKPQWDDEIMDGFKPEGGADNDDEEEEEDDDDYDNEEEQGVEKGGERDGKDEQFDSIEPVEDGEPPRKKSKKEQLKEKKLAKKEKEALKLKAQEIIDANTLKIKEEIEEEAQQQEQLRGRSRNKLADVKFKYREVSPETFGLTTRDILLADDTQLNSYIGIKKFAPYRPKELRMKDKRKYAKKKHLQEWRKETFKGLHIPEEAKDGEIWIPGEAESKHKSKTKSKDKSRTRSKKSHK